MKTIIQAKKLSKQYAQDENRVTALKEVDLEILRGEKYWCWDKTCERWAIAH